MILCLSCYETLRNLRITRTADVLNFPFVIIRGPQTYCLIRPLYTSNYDILPLPQDSGPVAWRWLAWEEHICFLVCYHLHLPLFFFPPSLMVQLLSCIWGTEAAMGKTKA